MYGRYFASAFTGSMVGSGLAVFAVWGYVIANTRRDGTVELNPSFLAGILGCAREDVEGAITKLSEPDPDSRSQKEDGRRLLKQGTFLYFVPTYADYGKIKDENDRREYMRKYMRERRADERAEKEGEDGTAPVNTDVKDVNTDVSKESPVNSASKPPLDHVVVVAPVPELKPVAVDARAEDSPQSSPQRPLPGEADEHADPIRQGKDDSTRARELCIAVNMGLQDNPLIGGNFMPVISSSAANLTAAEQIAEQGVHHAYAVRAAYTMAKTFKPAKRGDSIGSLAWIPPRLARPWERERAKIAASSAPRPQEAETALLATGGADRGVDAVNGQGGANSDGAELTRRNGHRDVKGEGLIIFGRIRAAIAERTVLNNPEDPGAGNRLQRAIDPAILGELSPAAQTALGAIGGARKVARMEEKELASCPWQFAAAYAAAVNSGESTSTEKVK